MRSSLFVVAWATLGPEPREAWRSDDRQFGVRRQAAPCARGWTSRQMAWVAAFAALAPSQVRAQQGPNAHHNVMVRVVRVTPDWHAYEGGGGWPAAVPIRESDVLKFFEVAIWEETKSIHFYEFDNDFDPHGWDLTPEEQTARRESYRIQRVDGLPEPWTEASITRCSRGPRAWRRHWSAASIYSEEATNTRATT